MSTRKCISGDSRYVKFAERYANDIAAFAAEVCGFDVSPWQDAIFRNIQEPGGSVLMDKAGHVDSRPQIPVTRATVALWSLLTQFQSNTYVGVTRLRHWHDGTHKDIAHLLELIRAGSHGWVADHVVKNKCSFYLVGFPHTWFITVRCVHPAYPERLAGTHGDQLMWILQDSRQMSEACRRVVTVSLRFPGRLLRT